MDRKDGAVVIELQGITCSGDLLANPAPGLRGAPRAYMATYITKNEKQSPSSPALREERSRHEACDVVIALPLFGGRLRDGKYFGSGCGVSRGERRANGA